MWGTFVAEMGREKLKREDEDTQLQAAFKKLKVDPEWSLNQSSISVENVKDLWLSDPSPAMSQTSGKVKKSHLKHGVTHPSRLEPYPQDFLFSMEQLTFHSEVCNMKSCTSSELGMKSKKHFNYATSSLHHEPLIREAKLKCHHFEKDTKQVLRAAKLKIYEQSKPDHTSITFKSPVLGSLKSPVLSDNTKFPLFGAACNSSEIDDFHTLVKADLNKLTTKQEKQKVYKFDICQQQGLLKRQQNCVDGMLGLSRNSYSDCGRELMYSQQAKVDDMSVDELAGYFETFVHIPRKMSSMAEMMYT